MTCNSNTVIVKSGDTAIEFTDTLTQDGVAVDLTGATVLFLLRLRLEPFTAYSLAATIVTAASGTVKYVPGAGYPTAVGKYEQEWQVTFGDATVLTFPSSGYNTLIIESDLN